MKGIVKMELKIQQEIDAQLLEAYKVMCKVLTKYKFDEVIRAIVTETFTRLNLKRDLPNSVGMNQVACYLVGELNTLIACETARAHMMYRIK